MYTLLVWIHVGLMMVAFGASPLGRLALRYLISGASDPHAAKPILRGFSRIFQFGGIAVTLSVCIGLYLARRFGLTQTWVSPSIALITLAGVGSVVIEDNWLTRLSRAEGDAFTAILHEKVPRVAAFASPLIWLMILWLMIKKPV